MPIVNGEYICKKCGFNAGRSPFILLDHAKVMHGIKFPDLGGELQG